MQPTTEMIETIKDFKEAKEFYQLCKAAYERAQHELYGIHPDVQKRLLDRLKAKIQQAHNAMKLAEISLNELAQQMPEFKNRY